jgi:putative heme-binding domain-containing protein
MRAARTGFLLSALATAAFSISSPVFAQGGPPGPPGGGPPPPDGSKLYADNCSQCHGDDGDNVSNVDLMHNRFRRGTTDTELTGIVLKGIPGTDMPPHSFTEAQAAAIVQYLRTQADRSASTAGNATNGKTIFMGKGGCTQCHRVEGVGVRVAPDLSEIGRLRHSDEIQRSILDPDASIVPSNRFVKLVTKDGATLSGRLLNHDTFTVQIIDMKEQLVSQPMSNIREFTFIDKSLMPSYRDKLSAQELTDLVSYLVSLKGGTQ